MTKEEFEKRYAKNSNLTIEELYDLGFYAKSCDCDWPGCKGWQMVFGRKDNDVHTL